MSTKERRIGQRILELVAERGPSKTICPSEVCVLMSASLPRKVETDTAPFALFVIGGAFPR